MGNKNGNRMRTNEKKREETSVGHKIFTVVGIVLSIILIPMLIINITLIVKSYINSEEVPSFGGFVPMIVLTDSMYPEIHSGDLIIGKTTEAESIKTGDVIAYFDPQGSGDTVVVHRVTEVKNENGELSFITKGDANNTEDAEPVPAENLVCIYDFRISGAGNIAMFMQTTPGLIICVVCPLVLLVGYDILRRRRYESLKAKDTAALMAELEALKAQKLEGTKDSGGEE